MKRRASVILIFLCIINISNGREQIEFDIVRKWAEKLSEELKQLSNFVSRREEAIQSFRDIGIHERSGKSLAMEIQRDLTAMMNLKKSAVRKIVKKAEETALQHHGDDVKTLQFNNMTMETVVTQNKRFHGAPVNTCHSSVYVPVNISANGSDILNPIKWSSDIDIIFSDNYARDPTLSWQYFGSSAGFMRQFPATQWTEETPDRYDCRTRPWFTQAASSSKDVIILVDNSASMSGVKKEVARHVVNHILDTLGDNDFVNVFSYTDKIDVVVPCFAEKLVQANLLNVLALKEGMKTLESHDVANLTEVLPVAFSILKDLRVHKKGSNCNQAIMLITDNLKDNHSEIFETYNRKKGSEIPVRVFTFFLGDDSSDNDVNLKWIACHNRGHFIPVKNVTEARNQVYTYIPVTARPMVLRKDEHPVIWSTIYTDVEDIDMKDQLERFKERYNLRKYLEINGENSESDEEAESSCKYRLVVSVSMPVYDKRETAIIPIREYFSKEERSPVKFKVKMVERRIARLLGVAGVDVPIEEVAKHFAPHKMGVNGYAFLVTNNGYVLAHPNLRPSYYGLLKPIYNSIDLTEIEMVNNTIHPRVVHPHLLELRDEIVNQLSGRMTLKMKEHYDCMRRVSVFDRHYHYVAIPDTPFTLVLSLPTSHEPLKLHEKPHTQGVHFMKYFRGQWNIHPDWRYCYYYYDNDYTFNTPESELLHFVHRSQQPDWQWVISAYHSSNHGSMVKSNKDSYFCDKELVLSAMHHAKNTEWFLKTFPGSNKNNMWNHYNSRFNISLMFLSTYSGFTRWKSFNEKERDYIQKHKKSIDETWYKRTVELNKDSDESFLYSVPFHSGNEEESTVTVTQAVYPRKGHKNHRYPLAVTGFKFSLDSLHSLLKDVTYNCPQGSRCGAKTCSSEELDCYILDNNGYIIVSENYEDNAGKFFGEVRGHIMQLMHKDDIYRRIPIYDYQAMCLRPDNNGNVASYIFTPLNNLKWIMMKLVWIIYNMWWGDGVHAALETEESSNVEPASLHDMMTRNIRPELCDTETNLYLLNNDKKIYYKRSENCTRPYVVQKIGYSNTILVVINSLCPEDEMTLSTKPIEITYDETSCPEDNKLCTESLACFKANNLSFARRMPKNCYDNHPDEIEIRDQCGKSYLIKSNSNVVAIVTVFTTIVYYYSLTLNFKIIVK